MSLIVARKSEGQLCIVSDTKLSYPNHEVKGLKDSPSEGVVKSVIINQNICISFAGELSYAEAALRLIFENDSIENIIEILKRYHVESDYRTEFLLCYYCDEPIIYKFKDNEYGPVVSSWIGDQKAFNRFQESMSGVRKESKQKKKKQEKALPSSNKPAIIFESMNLSFEASSPKYLSRMSSAMDEVIEDGNINSVGGFKVNVIYKDRFYYNFYTKSYRGQFAMIGLGSHIIGHGGSDEGAYSLNFFGGSRDFKSLALHIRQASLGIVYHREGNGLLKPTLFRMDEVDFSDLVKERYQLHAPMLTQDRLQKFTNEGRRAFQQKDFRKASEYFDKAIQSAQGKQKAEVLFFKGVALLNLNDHPKAIAVFQEAISIEPAIQQKINELFSKGSTKA